MKILKVALSFIFFHSLLSVMVLYSYTLWVLKENDEQFYEPMEEHWSPDNILVWPEKVIKNVLSNEVIRSDEIGVRGWWMAHEKWSVNVECFNKEWGTCIKVFSVPCKVDSVRSIYQWVPIKPGLTIKKLLLSLRSSAEDLRREASDAFYGALAIVKLNDNSFETIQIKLSEDSHYRVLKETIFETPLNNSSIISVTLMLCCYGYIGLIKFLDVSLLLSTGNEYHDANSAVATCPHIVSSNTENSFKTEILNISKQITTNYLHQVTLVTQVSMDRLGILEKSLSAWEGPISIAIFIPFMLQKSQEDPEWQRMYMQKKLQLLSNSYIQVTLVYGQSPSDEYPINYLRNVAIKRASTQFVFLVDADFTPASDFQPKFDVVTRAYRQTADKTAWVVPAFEYLEPPSIEEPPPKTKEDLVEQILTENSNIQPFRVSESPESHRLTDYWHWYRAEHPYEIYGYNDKYEPYVILKKTPHMSMYNERFSGYGMNKVSHITELFAAGYQFKVLHDLWVIHVPHRTTSYTVSFLQNPHKRLQNRAIRFEFLGQIMEKYNIGPCEE